MIYSYHDITRDDISANESNKEKQQENSRKSNRESNTGKKQREYQTNKEDQNEDL